MSDVRSALVAMIDRALGDDAREALAAVRELDAEVDWLKKKAVAQARRDGFDWGRIGRLLGVTRQSARERYRVIVPAPPPHIVAKDRYLRHNRETERLINRMQAGRPEPGDQGDVVPW
jgi:hypothetical protein